MLVYVGCAADYELLADSRAEHIYLDLDFIERHSNSTELQRKGTCTNHTYTHREKERKDRRKGRRRQTDEKKR